MPVLFLIVSCSPDKYLFTQTFSSDPSSSLHGLSTSQSVSPNEIFDLERMICWQAIFGLTRVSLLTLYSQQILLNHQTLKKSSSSSDLGGVCLRPTKGLGAGVNQNHFSLYTVPKHINPTTNYHSSSSCRNIQRESKLVLFPKTHIPHSNTTHHHSEICMEGTALYQQGKY